MTWKYFIPHVWESEETIWEDIYLRQTDEPEKKTLFLSINGRLMFREDDKLSVGQSKILAHLEQHDYLINDTEMYLKLDSFTLEQLLQYTKIFLEDKGYKDISFIAGDYDDFIDEIEEIYAKGIQAGRDYLKNE